MWCESILMWSEKCKVWLNLSSKTIFSTASNSNSELVDQDPDSSTSMIGAGTGAGVAVTCLTAAIFVYSIHRRKKNASNSQQCVKIPKSIK